jgi:hypothetical protein
MARLERQVWTVVDYIGHDLSETGVLEAGDPLIAVSPVSGHAEAAGHEMPLSRVPDAVAGNHAEALEKDLLGMISCACHRLDRKIFYRRPE